MKENLVIVTVIALILIHVQSCQKSEKIKLGNFPSAWYFPGENAAGEPVFYLSCDGESTGIKIEKSEGVYELTILENGELFDEDNTGEFTLTDPYSSEHTLSFDFAEDRSSAVWSLDGQLIGRFIADKMPDEIEKIYPPCIECKSFD